MYQLVKAVMRRFKGSEGYKPVDISTLTINQITEEFSDGYVQLFNTVTGQNTYTRLHFLLEQPLKRVSGNFITFLNANAQLNIEGSLVEPTLEEVKVQYYNANRNMFEIIQIQNDDLTDRNLSKDNKQNFYIWHDLIEDEYREYISKTWITVNGLIHYAYMHADQRGVVIANGGLTANFSEVNRPNFMPSISMYTANRKLTHVLLRDRYSAGTTNPAHLYRSGFVIDAGASLTNKTVAFVLLGKLFFLDNQVVSIVNDTHVRIDLSKVDLLKLIFAVSQTLDLRPLGFLDGEFATGAVSLEQLNDNQIIKNIIESPYTFLTVIDAPIMAVEYTPLVTAQYGGLYTDTFDQSQSDQYRPAIVNEFGMLVDYIAFRNNQHRDGTIGINVKTSSKERFRSFVYETTDNTQLDVVPPVLDDVEKRPSELRRMDLRLQQMIWA